MYFASEAAALLAELRKSNPPYFLFLDGPLGAGKTTFAQALIAAMGADASQVQSPTFLKLVEYQVGSFGRVAHMDCHRMAGPQDVLKMGLDSYADRLVRMWIIEWPSPFEAAIRSNLMLARNLGYTRPWRLSFSGNAQNRSVRWSH